uniref:Uncharacterized protein n=1 Tax=Anopheles atroparvus TaxID=41427 RepID=A0A182IQ90_ANOAO
MVLGKLATLPPALTAEGPNAGHELRLAAAGESKTKENLRCRRLQQDTMEKEMELQHALELQKKKRQLKETVEQVKGKIMLGEAIESTTRTTSIELSGVARVEEWMKWAGNPQPVAEVAAPTTTSHCITSTPTVGAVANRSSSMIPPFQPTFPPATRGLCGALQSKVRSAVTVNNTMPVTTYPLLYPGATSGIATTVGPMPSFSASYPPPPVAHQPNLSHHSVPQCEGFPSAAALPPIRNQQYAHQYGMAGPSHTVACAGPSQQQLLARQVMPKDLPTFRGDPEDWPFFYCTFVNTTEACEYGDAENLARLQRALQGKAYEAVKSRLLLPGCVRSERPASVQNRRVIKCSGTATENNGTFSPLCEQVLANAPARFIVRCQIWATGE